MKLLCLGACRHTVREGLEAQLMMLRADLLKSTEDWQGQLTSSIVTMSEVIDDQKSELSADTAELRQVVEVDVKAQLHSLDTELVRALPCSSRRSSSW